MIEHAAARPDRRVGRARAEQPVQRPTRQARRVDVTGARRGQEQGAHRPAQVTSTVPRPPGGLAGPAHPRPAGVRHARGARAPGRHRGRVELAAAPQGARAAARPASAAEGGRASAMSWWIGGLFAIGSLCFALGSVPLYFDALDPGVVAGTFFVGSIFFTSAAYLQFHETLRAPGGVLARVRAAPAGCASLVGLEAAPDRLLGGAGPAGRHGVLQHQHLRGHAGRPDGRAGAAPGLGAGRLRVRSASSSPAGSPTPR